MGRPNAEVSCIRAITITVEVLSDRGSGTDISELHSLSDWLIK
jgi:hypothetical protein